MLAEDEKITWSKGRRFGFYTGKTLRYNHTMRDRPVKHNDWTYFQTSDKALSEAEKSTTIQR